MQPSQKTPSQRCATVEPQKAACSPRWPTAPASTQGLPRTPSPDGFKEARKPGAGHHPADVADQYASPDHQRDHGFPDKGGGVTPVVGVDGWNRIASSTRSSTASSSATPTRWSADGGKICPEWIECVVLTQATAPPDRHPRVPRRVLPPRPARGRATPSGCCATSAHQGYRTAFGFHGIYDEDEAERMYYEDPGDLLQRQCRQRRELLQRLLPLQRRRRPLRTNLRPLTRR